MTSYCSAAAKYSDQQELSPDFWSDVDFTEGQGVNGGRYAQRMFRFRFNYYVRMMGCSYGMYQTGDVG